MPYLSVDVGLSTGLIFSARVRPKSAVLPGRVTWNLIRKVWNGQESIYHKDRPVCRRPSEGNDWPAGWSADGNWKAYWYFAALLAEVDYMAPRPVNLQKKVDRHFIFGKSRAMQYYCIISAVMSSLWTNYEHLKLAWFESGGAKKVTIFSSTSQV